MSKDQQIDFFQAEPEEGWTIEFQVIVHDRPIGEDLGWMPLYIHTKPTNNKKPIEHTCGKPPWEECDCLQTKE